MTNIDNILSNTSHRPFAFPAEKWQYYQEWNRVLFLHWVVPFDLLRKCVPDKFSIDVFEGNCYVSLVAFTMQKVRPRQLPSISFISDFDEINLRTYVDNDNKKGVYFLNIEAGKSLSALIAKSLSGLPYEKAAIKRGRNKYASMNPRKGFCLDASFEIKEEIKQKTELDKWLTERYCLYLDHSGGFYRYEIHHEEWKISNIDLDRLQVEYKMGDIDLAGRRPDVVHYSEGVKVISWRRQEM